MLLKANDKVSLVHIATEFRTRQPAAVADDADRRVAVCVCVCLS